MRIWSWRLSVLRAGPTGLHNFEIVAELCAQADWMGVVVVLAIARLVSEAGVERLGFAVEGVSCPDPVSYSTGLR